MLYVEYLPLYMESSAINKKNAVGGRGEVTVLEGGSRFVDYAVVSLYCL